MHDVTRAIEAAERILPGEAAPEGEADARWHAIIAVGEFTKDEPEAVWRFVVKWGVSPDSVSWTDQPDRGRFLVYRPFAGRLNWSADKRHWSRHKHTLARRQTGLGTGGVIPVRTLPSSWR